MVLHTIIGEYDILYAQERELAGYCGKNVPQAVMSTNPQDFLETTALSKIVRADNRYSGRTMCAPTETTYKI